MVPLASTNGNPTKTTATTTNAEANTGSTLPSNTSAADYQNKTNNIPKITRNSRRTKDLTNLKDLATSFSKETSAINNPTDSTVSNDDQPLTKASTTKTTMAFISRIKDSFKIPPFPLNNTLTTNNTIIHTNQTKKTQPKITKYPPSTPTLTNKTEYLSGIPDKMFLTRPKAQNVTLRSIIVHSSYATTTPTSSKHGQTARKDMKTNITINTDPQPPTIGTKLMRILTNPSLTNNSSSNTSNHQELPIIKSPTKTFHLVFSLASKTTTQNSRPSFITRRPSVRPSMLATTVPKTTTNRDQTVITDKPAFLMSSPITNILPVTTVPENHSLETRAHIWTKNELSRMEDANYLANITSLHPISSESAMKNDNTTSTSDGSHYDVSDRDDTNVTTRRVSAPVVGLEEINIGIMANTKTTTPTTVYTNPTISSLHRVNSAAKMVEPFYSMTEALSNSRKDSKPDSTQTHIKTSLTYATDIPRGTSDTYLMNSTMNEIPEVKTHTINPAKDKLSLNITGPKAATEDPSPLKPPNDSLNSRIALDATTKAPIINDIDMFSTTTVTLTSTTTSKASTPYNTRPITAFTASKRSPPETSHIHLDKSKNLFKFPWENIVHKKDYVTQETRCNSTSTTLKPVFTTASLAPTSDIQTTAIHNLTTISITNTSTASMLPVLTTTTDILKSKNPLSMSTENVRTIIKDLTSKKPPLISTTVSQLAASVQTNDTLSHFTVVPSNTLSLRKATINPTDSPQGLRSQTVHKSTSNPLTREKLATLDVPETMTETTPPLFFSMTEDKSSTNDSAVIVQNRTNYAPLGTGSTVAADSEPSTDPLNFTPSTQNTSDTYTPNINGTRTFTSSSNFTVTLKTTSDFKCNTTTNPSVTPAARTGTNGISSTVSGPTPPADNHTSPSPTPTSNDIQTLKNTKPVSSGTLTPVTESATITTDNTRRSKTSKASIKFQAKTSDSLISKYRPTTPNPPTTNTVTFNTGAVTSDSTIVIKGTINEAMTKISKAAVSPTIAQTSSISTYTPGNNSFTKIPTAKTTTGSKLGLINSAEDVQTSTNDTTDEDVTTKKPPLISTVFTPVEPSGHNTDTPSQSTDESPETLAPTPTTRNPSDSTKRLMIQIIHGNTLNLRNIQTAPTSPWSIHRTTIVPIITEHPTTTPTLINTTEDQRSTTYNPAISADISEAMTVTTVDRNTSTDSPLRFLTSTEAKYNESSTDALNYTLTQIKNNNSHSPTTNTTNTNTTFYTISVILKSTVNFKDKTAASISDTTTHTVSTVTHTSSPLITLQSAITELTPNSTKDSPTTGNMFIASKETLSFRDIETTRDTLTSTTKTLNGATDHIINSSTTFAKSVIKSSESLNTAVKSLVTQPQSSTPNEAYVTAYEFPTIKLSSTTGSKDTATAYMSTISNPSSPTIGQSDTRGTPIAKLTTISITNTTNNATFLPITSSGDKLNTSDISNKTKLFWTTVKELATRKHPPNPTAATLMTYAQTTDTPYPSTPPFSTTTDNPNEGKEDSSKAIYMNTTTTTPGSINSTTSQNSTYSETNPVEIPTYSNTTKGFPIPSSSSESGDSSSTAYILKPRTNSSPSRKEPNSTSYISFITSSPITADGSNATAIVTVPTTVSAFTPEDLKSSSATRNQTDFQNISKATSKTANTLPAGFTSTTITPSPGTVDITTASTINYDLSATMGKTTNATNSISLYSPERSSLSSDLTSPDYLRPSTPLYLASSLIHESETSSSIAPSEPLLISSSQLLSSRFQLTPSAHNTQSSPSYFDQKPVFGRSFPVSLSTSESPDKTAELMNTAVDGTSSSSPDTWTITSGSTSSNEYQPTAVGSLNTLSTNSDYLTAADDDDPKTPESTTAATSTFDNPGTTTDPSNAKNPVISLRAPMTLTNRSFYANTVDVDSKTPKRTTESSTDTLISASNPSGTDYITAETGASRCATTHVSDASTTDTNCLVVKDSQPPRSYSEVIKLFYPDYPGPSYYEPFHAFYHRLEDNSESNQIYQKCPFPQCRQASDHMDGTSLVPLPPSYSDTVYHVNFQQPAPRNPKPALSVYPRLPPPSIPRPSSLDNHRSQHPYSKIFQLFNKFNLPQSSNSGKPTFVYQRRPSSFQQNPPSPVYHNPLQPFWLKSRHTLSRPHHHHITGLIHAASPRTSQNPVSGLPPGFTWPHHSHFGLPRTASSGISQNVFGPPHPVIARPAPCQFSGPPPAAVSRTSHRHFSTLRSSGFSWPLNAGFSGRYRLSLSLPQRSVRPPHPAVIKYSN